MTTDLIQILKNETRIVEAANAEARKTEAQAEKDKQRAEAEMWFNLTAKAFGMTRDELNTFKPEYHSGYNRVRLHYLNTWIEVKPNKEGVVYVPGSGLFGSGVTECRTRLGKFIADTEADCAELKHKTLKALVKDDNSEDLKPTSKNSRT